MTVAFLFHRQGLFAERPTTTLSESASIKVLPGAARLAAAASVFSYHRNTLSLSLQLQAALAVAPASTLPLLPRVWGSVPLILCAHLCFPGRVLMLFCVARLYVRRTRESFSK